MDAEVVTLSKALADKSMARQRSFHRHPEMVWFEMQTSAIIAETLTELGYEVLTGKAVRTEQARIGVPSEEAPEEYVTLAIGRGAPAEYLTEEMREGYTGMIGILHYGEGSVVVLRFNIDTLGLHEDGTDNHRPHREGFVSVNESVIHACGHDGHAAISLGVAEVLVQLKNRLYGMVKLLFQPGEESTKGVRVMVANGHLDDVDFFTGTHIASNDGPDDGGMTPGAYGFLVTAKYDVYCHGQVSRTGGFPERGANAIVMAANAVVNLTTIPKRSSGIDRINTNTIEGGTRWSVVPNEAELQIEVREEATEINQYMEDCARRVCEGAAVMYGCACNMVVVGTAESQQSNEDLLTEIGQLIREEFPYLRVSSCENAMNWGSEDISLTMNRVQKRGGKATYIRSMAPMASAQRTIGFSFDEKTLTERIQTFAAIVYHFME